MKKLFKKLPVLFGAVLMMYSCSKEELVVTDSITDGQAYEEQAEYVITKQATEITKNAAISGGNWNIISGRVSSQGVCWSTSPNPTTANSKTVDPITSGSSFVSSITGLNPGTKYYVRAYVVSSAGTMYGNEVSFTTLPKVMVGDSYLGGKVFSVNYSTNTCKVAVNTMSYKNWTDAKSTALNYTSTTGVNEPWYLPSKAELLEVYQNRSVLGLGNYIFWSSTEYSVYRAYCQEFSTGYTTSDDKNVQHNVVAVRVCNF